jgi:murein L,D-transpeptidase YafK
MARAGEENSQQKIKFPVFTFCYQGKVSDSRFVVVDKSRQRVMVFRYLGDLELEYEYPCSTGSRPGHKQKEGDERTPEGIYYTTHRYKDNKVTIFGDQAIHLNFPNPFDKVQGHSGNGIYIHGTNQQLKPRSSNGCIVMRNQDLAVVAPLIKEQLTPVVVVQSFNLADLKKRVRSCNYLLDLEKWVKDFNPVEDDPSLALRKGNLPNLPGKLASLAPNLANLGKNRSIDLSTKGMMLLGLGSQWILVADQAIKKPRRKQILVTRRFFLNGDDPASARALKGDWVVSDLIQAKRLISLAPKEIAMAKAKPPKPHKPAFAPKPAAPKPEPKAVAKDEINRMLKSWMRSWQAKKLNYYMSHYARDFKSGDTTRADWKKRKRYLNNVYKVIRVRAKNLKITILDPARARVEFIQLYSSDWHKDKGLKKLELVHRRGKWLIKSETWTKI